MLSNGNMHHQNLNALTEGLILPVDIYDKDTRRVFSAGTQLDREKLKLVRRRCLFEFYTTDPWPTLTPREGSAESRQPNNRTADLGEADQEQPPEEAFSSQRPVSVKALRPGMRLAQGIYDNRGVLLLAANATVSSRFISLLRHRELESISLGPGPADGPAPQNSSNQTHLTKMLDARLEELALDGISPGSRRWHTGEALPPKALRAYAGEQLKDYERTARAFENAAREVLQGSRAAVDSADTMLKTFLDSIALDLNIIPHLLSLKTTPDEYLYHHCLNASLLSMTMAAQMSFSREDVLKAGLASLLHDIGMLKVDESIRLARRGLNPEEFLQIQAHPVHTLNLLEGAETFDPVMMLVAYQVHERCDRSGYPRGRHAQYIHILARIMAIADCYCAMTCPRPYREALKPYDAIAAILAQAKLGYFDTMVIRALLDCLSLYPIGSRVLLNTEQQARVARAVPDQYDRPTIILLDAAGNETEDIVELKDHHDLRVVNVLE